MIRQYYLDLDLYSLLMLALGEKNKLIMYQQQFYNMLEYLFIIR